MRPIARKRFIRLKTNHDCILDAQTLIGNTTESYSAGLDLLKNLFDTSLQLCGDLCQCHCECEEVIYFASSVKNHVKSTTLFG